MASPLLIIRSPISKQWGAKKSEIADNVSGQPNRIMNTTEYILYLMNVCFIYSPSPFPVEPVSCLTRNIPLPSSILFELLIPITLFGLGLTLPDRPSCLVGLILRVGVSPPPVSCLAIMSIPLPAPVN